MATTVSPPPARDLVQRTKKHPVAGEVYNIASTMVGAVVAALGIEGFLLPNDFLDGGIVGVSIIATQFVDLPLGVFIGLINIPFIVLAWVMVGHRAAVRSGLGIAALSAASIYLHLHHLPAFTDESWLALICGGAMIGVGIGIALRHGGALDGTEVLATILATRTQFTVGQIVLYINLGVFTLAGFVISWESALLSGVLFYVVVKDLIDQVAHGEHGVRRARVTTIQHAAVAEMISARINRPVLVDRHTHWYADGPGEDVWVVNFTCTRMEEATLVEDIEAVDPQANITFSDITNLHGPMFESLTNAGH